MEVTIWFWIGFNVFILFMLAVDLGIFHRNAHVVSFREALSWSAVWMALSLIFGLGVYDLLGHQKGVEYFTGYLIEYSLSMDNIFVFVLIFSYFHVPKQYQHRVLFWGIIGALIMRGIMIYLGAALIKEYGWILYIFGAFLVFTGIKMAVTKMEGIHPETNPIIKLFRKIFPVTRDFEGQKFFTIHKNKVYMTPLFLVLIMIETTDLIFAVDSIPAIFAITTDPFIVYTSNVFAILGLRSMYFMLGGIIHKFHYLKVGLAFVLTFVGAKMLLSHVYKIPTEISLAVIIGAIGSSIAISLLKDKEGKRK